MSKSTKYRDSMRMGSLNLLVLIISLCLAILAVLALASASSEMGLSNRQQQTIEQRNARELAGQSILYGITEYSAGSSSSLLDNAGTLEEIAQRSATLAQNRSGCAIVATAEMMDARHLYMAMDSAAGGSPDYEGTDGQDVDISSRVTGAETTYEKAVEEALSKCQLGVSATVESADGNMLHILLGIPKKSAPIVLKWSADREWEVSAEKLWTPAQDVQMQEQDEDM